MVEDSASPDALECSSEELPGGRRVRRIGVNGPRSSRIPDPAEPGSKRRSEPI